MKRIFARFCNSSIAHKIMVIVMTVIFVILSLSFFSFIAYDVYYNTRNAITSEVDLVARAISKRAAPVMLLQDKQEGQKVISDASIKESIILACLYTAKNNLLAEFNSKNNTKETCPKYTPEQTGMIHKSSRISLLHEVISPNNDKVASLYIVSDTRQINQKLQITLIWALLFLFAASTLSYLAVNKAKHIITNPILSLAKTAAAVSQHDYNMRANKYYDDELGILADSFNDMLSQVQRRDKELKNVNENLEKIVEERTHALEIAVVKAEAANEAKSEFLRNMSHEFRTPLHAMRCLSIYGVEDAEKGRGTDELKGYFKKISMVTGRLTDLVEGVLNIASMESGVAEFVMAKCDLSIIFEAVIAEHEALIKKKDLNLIYNKPDFPTEIICNQGKITQVVANLMGNAIKFTPSGKNITLSAKRDDQATYISISDEGVGVPEEQIEDIFKKFVQSTRTKTQAGGTGLGLTICMGIVNGHKGKIWAENNKDKGSTFTFTIPLNLGEGTITVKPNIL